MIQECDRVQRQKAARLYNFKQKKSDYELGSFISVARSCFDGLVLIVFSITNLNWFTRGGIFGPSVCNASRFNE